MRSTLRCPNPPRTYRITNPPRWSAVCHSEHFPRTGAVGVGRSSGAHRIRIAVGRCGAVERTCPPESGWTDLRNAELGKLQTRRREG